MERFLLARNAMATRFEFVLVGSDSTHLRAVAEEAFTEIERIEGQLSLYRASSEIAQVNARAGREPVRVSPPVLNLLLRARELWEFTDGLFDITVAPLVRCWGFMKGSGALPEDAAVEEARALVGMQNVILDENRSTVEFARPGMMLDLGSIGKGYALDLAVSLLRDNEIENALLHGGTSTVCALGCDSDGTPWNVAVEKPSIPQVAPEPNLTRIFQLRDAALSVSAPSGKAFESEGKVYGHVINPRTGRPAKDAYIGCAIVSNATDSDALSTAVLLGEDKDLSKMSANWPDLSYFQVRAMDGGEKVSELLRRGTISLLSESGGRA
jgi:thiamine biosynthesis lipoprotein